MSDLNTHRSDGKPEMTVTKLSCWQPVALDADGTPLANGERMIEIEPGVWAHPLAVATLEFLRAHAKETGSAIPEDD